ncbi:MAG: hypothetical protein H6592_02955 [Flavobacteriales bacterium]|nr:hypothetical protein [Flavobacteriales bacterium]HPF89536.1 glutamate--tRNA ligase family protein [Flavobacteriales bacterium]
MRTRIAPTPSGYLHVGNAFNFLVTAELVRTFGGTLVLRVDDLDQERVRPEYIEDVFRSLAWLGIQPDEGPSGPEQLRRDRSQLLRMERYAHLVDELRSNGHLYPCSCSRAERERQRTGAHRCRTQETGRVAAGTPWRLRVPEPCPVEWSEWGGATSQVELSTALPDPVIVQRGSGRPAYQVASLVDDLDMGIDHVVRGADLIPSTACQCYLARILERPAFQAIRFLHHPLATDATGRKLSKSAGDTSLRSMREAGSSPEPLKDEAKAYVAAFLTRVTG